MDDVRLKAVCSHVRAHVTEQLRRMFSSDDMSRDDLLRWVSATKAALWAVVAYASWSPDRQKPGTFQELVRLVSMRADSRRSWASPHRTWQYKSWVELRELGAPWTDVEYISPICVLRPYARWSAVVTPASVGSRDAFHRVRSQGLLALSAMPLDSLVLSRGAKADLVFETVDLTHFTAWFVLKRIAADVDVFPRATLHRNGLGVLIGLQDCFKSHALVNAALRRAKAPAAKKLQTVPLPPDTTGYFLAAPSHNGDAQPTTRTPPATRGAVLVAEHREAPHRLLWLVTIDMGRLQHQLHDIQEALDYATCAYAAAERERLRPSPSESRIFFDFF